MNSRIQFEATQQIWEKKFQSTSMAACFRDQKINTGLMIRVNRQEKILSESTVAWSLYVWFQ